MNKHEIIANKYQERYEKILLNSFRNSTTTGCSYDEINKIQLKYDINLPRSYRVFLENFGKCPGYLLGDIDLEYPCPLTQTEDMFYPMLLPNPEDDYIPPIEIPDKVFIFANYYGQRIYFFILGDESDDSEVFIADSSQGSGAIFEYTKIADSFWDLVESIVKSLERLYKVN
jgi:hypothetical protein